MVQVHDKALEQENGGDILLVARVVELLHEGARRRGRQVRRNQRPCAAAQLLPCKERFLDVKGLLQVYLEHGPVSETFQAERPRVHART